MEVITKLTYLSGFNNYYNRTIKKPDSTNISDYEEYIIRTDSEVNFNQNDNVSASCIINYIPPIPGAFVDTIDDSTDIDYVLYTDDDGNIISKWFVIDRTRETGGQFRLSIRRDLISDYWSNLLTSPVFVEKGNLAIDSPFLFLNEDIGFNQILTDYNFLYDKSGCPWVVGYIPKDAFNTSEGQEIQATAFTTESGYDLTTTSLNNWEYTKFIDAEDGYINKIIDTRINVRVATALTKLFTLQLRGDIYKYSTDSYGINRGIGGTASKSFAFDTTVELVNSLKDQLDSKWHNTYIYWQTDDKDDSYNENIFSKIKNTNTTKLAINTCKDLFNADGHKSITELYTELNGKILYDIETSKKYKINIIPGYKTKEINITSTSTNLASTLQALKQDWNNAFEESFLSLNASDSTFYFTTDLEYCDIQLEQITTGAKVTINNERLHLVDQPFDMFCMPYSDTFSMIEELEGVSRRIIASKSLATNIATHIGANVGSNKVFDVQILPYCPIQQYLKEGYAASYLDATSVRKDYIKAIEDDSIIGFLFWCDSSSFTANIPLSIPDITTSPIDKKVASQTSLFRLVDPGSTKIFEFDPYKNNGVDYFTAYCTYKPWNPFIKVAPNWKALYGISSQYDVKGLICNCDFSLPQATSAWAEYVSNNKNYEAIFNRGIEHTEIIQNYERFYQIAGIIGSAANASLDGLSTGAATGNPYAAAAGAAIGAIGSAGFGMVDYNMSEKLRNEAIDYSKDQFGYQLGNIQAIPQGLSKSSPIDISNALVPLLLYYTCTDEEKQAFKDKLKYNGMKVMKIDYLLNYSIAGNGDNFFKVKLIRLQDSFGESFGEFHEVNELATELYKGWYI